MIIGASLGSFIGFDMPRAMELYITLSREFRLDAVEVRLEREEERPSLWSSQIEGTTEADLRKFLSLFRVSGVHLPFIYLDPISPNPGIALESIQQLETGIEVASRLGCNYALMHASGAAYGVPREEQLSRWQGVLERLAGLAERRLVQLTVENGAFLSNLRELAALVRRVGSRGLRLTLDTGHAYARQLPSTDHSIRGMLREIGYRVKTRFDNTGYMPFQDYGSLGRFVEVEGDLIYSLHIHDHNGRTDHLVIGEGGIDFSFLRALADRTLLIESIFREPRRDIRTSLQRLREILSAASVRR